MLLVAAAVLRWQTLGAFHERRASSEHYARLETALQSSLMALLNEEVGLRGYLVTGDRSFLDPYYVGRAEEHDAARDFVQLFTRTDRANFGQAWVEFRDAAAEWHRAVAEPQIVRRAAGPLADLPGTLSAGKEAFDRLRVEYAELQTMLRARAADEAVERERAVEHTNLVAAVMIFGVIAFAVALIRSVVRHTADPLQRLAASARGASPLGVIAGGRAVAEVHDLARALGELEAQVRERERLLEVEHAEAVAIGNFGEFVQQITDESELHPATARALEQTLHPKSLHILVRGAGRDRLEPAWDGGHPLLDRTKFSILDDPMRCRAVRTGKAVSANAGAPTACPCPFGVPASGSYLCAPMHVAGEVVGLVNLQSDARDRWSGKARGVVQGYVNFASSGLGTMRLLRATRERALRDPLTGAYNRGFLAEHLARRLGFARGASAPLSVLMLDLDYFKRLNDTYGHAVGDRALVSLAACLQQQVRPDDAVVRYGGEEFVVVLVDAAAEAALAVAERIRRAVEGTVIVAAGGAPGPALRTSIGVASYPEHGVDEATLLAAADRALYLAKERGRNRVVAVSEAVPARTGHTCGPTINGAATHVGAGAPSASA